VVGSCGMSFRGKGKLTKVIYGWFGGMGYKWILRLSTLSKRDGAECGSRWMDSIHRRVTVRSRFLPHGSRSVESETRGLSHINRSLISGMFRRSCSPGMVQMHA
jgi:hypothetical protein